MKSEASLKARIRRLEDIEDIRRTMARYCRNYDTGWPGANRNSAAVGALFTEDAIWDAGPSGRWSGRQDIERWCAELGHAAKLSVHIAMNPEIDLATDSATGSWSGLCPLVSPDGEALWVCGRYDCKLLRTDEGWKFSEMVFLPAFLSPYEDGFGKTPFLQSASYDAALAGQSTGTDRQ